MSESTQPAGASQLYRAFWRWHFYAGLLVLPLLMLMALTGGLYLFRNEIGEVLYRPLVTVEARASTTSPETWVSAAERGLGGKVVQLTRPAEADRSVELVVDRQGAKRTAYVDPHDGRLLGSTPQGGVMAVVKRLHSLDLFGPAANLLVEVVAGWAIVLVATGIFLWWPRGQAEGVLTIRARPAKRLFWRDVHAVTGVFAGAVIVFLAATGMPWSAVWGQQVRRMTTEAGLGRPPAPRAGDAHAAHGGPMATSDAVPWALQHMHMHGDGGADTAALPLDRIVARLDGSGLGRPYVLTFPKTDGGVWSAAYMPDRIEDTRTLYLDGRSGRAVADIGYRDFGAAARAIEWGISVHQGQQYGPLNKALMAAGCVSVWVLGLSAMTMWWKRRPRRGLGAPAPPDDPRVYRGLALVVTPFAILYPLVGASLAIVLGLDLLLRRSAPKVRALIGA